MIELINDNCVNVLPSILEKYKDRQIIIVTDPPFNVGYHYETYNDKMEEEDYYAMLKSLLGNTPSVVIHYPEQLYRIAIEMQKVPTKVVSWVYNSNTAKQHRDIAFFDVKPDFSKIRQPYKNLNDKRIQERIANGCEGAKLYDWWEINQVKNINKHKFEHPCQMPLDVMTNIIGILPSDCLVIDPFMGSGTTGIACKMFGVDFVGIELDEKYYQIVQDRFNGIEPNGQMSFLNF